MPASTKKQQKKEIISIIFGDSVGISHDLLFITLYPIPLFSISFPFTENAELQFFFIFLLERDGQRR